MLCNNKKKTPPPPFYYDRETKKSKFLLYKSVYSFSCSCSWSPSPAHREWRDHIFFSYFFAQEMCVRCHNNFWFLPLMNLMWRIRRISTYHHLSLSYIFFPKKQRRQKPWASTMRQASHASICNGAQLSTYLHTSPLLRYAMLCYPTLHTSSWLSWLTNNFFSSRPYTYFGMLHGQPPTYVRHDHTHTHEGKDWHHYIRILASRNATCTKVIITYHWECIHLPPPPLS